MPIGKARLSLLPFPQLWDGASIALRFLCLPKGDPEAPLNPDQLAFSNANLVFQANLISGLAHLPLSGDATPSEPLAVAHPPIDKAALFSELKKNITIVPRGPDPGGPTPVLRKSFTESYRALIGDRQRSQFLSSAAEFDCAVHGGATDQPEEPVVLPQSLSWGKVIALCLRQPNLASALGLMVEVTVTPPDPGFFAAGGWIYIDLDPSSDYAAFGVAARYAARIPALSADSPRPLFAPLLFPVTDVPSDKVLDDIFAEAELYEDGLAKMVHSAQTSEHGDGIRLAWEDEQIADWLNRQLERDPVSHELMTDTPLGVAGYRIDVRNAGDNAWNSLVTVESGDLTLGAVPLGTFTGEAVIEVSPTQLSPKQPGAFWFPSYFTTWRGSSLALTDADLSRIHGRADVRSPESLPHLLQREKNFTPLNDKRVPLLYGNTYEFRVRMADLTRGGPDSSAPSPDPPRNSISTLTFQRNKAPGPVEVLQRPPDVERQIYIARPRLGYPEILFTGAPFSKLEEDLNALSADRSITREISLPDPDVATVQIDVQVKALDGDVTTWLLLYRTSRAWKTDEMTIAFDVQDHPTLLTIYAKQPDEGSLVLPAARDLRLTLAGVGHDRPGYFASPEARVGASVNIDLRALAMEESQLLSAPKLFPSLRSFFFQPPPPDNSVASPVERLAAEMGLNRTGLTLSGRPDNRTVIACSAHMRHTLSPEASAITFSSAADLIQRWINVVQFSLERDWTWDGLDPTGISVTRVAHLPTGDTHEVVGAITLPRALAQQVKAALPATPDEREDPARNPIRQSTEVIFFDALDPKPAPGKYPSEITVDYILQPAFKGVSPPDPVSPSILLPVTTAPTQLPRIVSAGIALSEYIKADDYSSTAPRQRMLWLEFAEKPADPDDSYYVRVRALGPDPLLLPADLVPPDVPETSLALDPEWVRAIVPGQPLDENGLNAMQPLADSPAAPHYLVPLPANLKESSPELFGFFVYEVRIGHTDSRWCTAQGRFGPLLRIAGVQHPAPPLVCQGVRSPDGVLIRAPYATPVLDGGNVRPPAPATEIWALLYARVPQMDRKAWRNLLISRAVLAVSQLANDPQDIGPRVLYGEGLILTQTLNTALKSFGLALDTPLTVLAAELFRDPSDIDPVGERLGYSRTLRISALAEVRDAC